MKKEAKKLIQEATVTFLKKPEVSFVSLVKHGANNTPFRLLKSNKAGGDDMNKIVQAVRVHKDSKADLKKIVGDGFRDDKSVEDGDYIVYEQIDKSICNIDTKSVVVLDPANHVYAVTYNQLENAQDKKEVDKDLRLPVLSLKSDAKGVSYWDVVDEMYAMGDLIYGSMGQSNMPPEDRKDIVFKAIDNFKAFCDTIFSEIKTAVPLPVGKAVGERTAMKLLEVLQKQVSTKSNEGGENMFELKDKDELIGIVTEAVDSAITAKTLADAKSAEVLATQEAEKAAKEATVKEVNDLKESVKTLTGAVEKFSGTVVSQPNIDDADPDKKEAGQKSVYSGMFSNRALSATPSISEAA